LERGGNLHFQFLKTRAGREAPAVSPCGGAAGPPAKATIRR
jgi:hypothetical protein